MEQQKESALDIRPESTPSLPNGNDIPMEATIEENEVPLAFTPTANATGQASEQTSKQTTEEKLDYDKNVGAGYYKDWLHTTPVAPTDEAVEVKPIGAYQMPVRTSTADIKFKDTKSPTLTTHSISAEALQKAVKTKEWQESERLDINEQVVGYMEYEKPNKNDPESSETYTRAVSLYPPSAADSAAADAKRHEDGRTSANVSYPSSITLQDGNVKLPKGTAVLVRDFKNIKYQDKNDMVSAVESMNTHVKTSLKATVDGKVGAVVERANYTAEQREALYDAGQIPEQTQRKAYKSDIKASVLNNPQKAAENTHSFVQEVNFSSNYEYQHSGVQSFRGTQNGAEQNGLTRASYDNTKQQNAFKAEEATLNIKPTAGGKLGVAVTAKDANGKAVESTTAIRDSNADLSTSCSTKISSSSLASKNFDSLQSGQSQGQSQSAGIKI